MTEQEVIDLLSIITAYDKRSTGSGEFRAWCDAAQRNRWSFAEASEAVKAHYAESTRWLMPGHINERIRACRADPPQPQALPSGTPGRGDQRQRVVRSFAERFQADREQRSTEQRACLAVACPHCGAAPRQACWQTTGDQALTQKPPIDVPHRHRRQAYRTQE